MNSEKSDATTGKGMEIYDSKGRCYNEEAIARIQEELELRARAYDMAGSTGGPVEVLQQFLTAADEAFQMDQRTSLWSTNTVAPYAERVRAWQKVRRLREQLEVVVGIPDGRLARQQLVHVWCKDTFGDAQASSIPQRGLRLVEEAIEAGQAAGCTEEMVHRLVTHVYQKPVGELSQELGGVGVTLLALAQAALLSADACEAAEVARITSMPREHFAQRNAAKNAAGFDASAWPNPTVPGE